MKRQIANKRDSRKMKEFEAEIERKSQQQAIEAIKKQDIEFKMSKQREIQAQQEFLWVKKE